MDKERLLAHFQEHYLPRREVLFRLPLNYPISSFWPELLSRRKASAVMLPLHNASGHPCWYMLTHKMIAASEMLAEEALAIDDPAFGFEMTTAMTKEMYFTSFVEGAQISFEDAMAFLERGTEPENILEQMILNNQQAWSAMVQSLYHPLDETYIKALAQMLTVNMDNEADDYRQVDTHIVAAMRTEKYEVPTAAALPDRMTEFYQFLDNPDIHPLIKAAAGQAFLLITRPFPEGNERLSRMISSAVLMRSGYDFFRDISLSASIAPESHLYYRSMCEIMRPENDGDLTYFMEYFLELLARSLKAKKEYDRLASEEEMNTVLERERQLAKQPLGSPASPIPVAEPEPTDNTILLDAPLPFSTPAAPEIIQADLPTEIQQAEQAPENDTLPAHPIETLLREKIASSWPTTKSIFESLLLLFQNKTAAFTSTNIIAVSGASPKAVFNILKRLTDTGVLSREKETKIQHIYSFNTAYRNASDTVGTEADVSDYDESDAVEHADGPVSFDNTLTSLEAGASPVMVKAANTIRNLVAQGIHHFDGHEWRQFFGASESQSKTALKLLQQKGILRIEQREGSRPLYFIQYSTDPNPSAEQGDSHNDERIAADEYSAEGECSTEGVPSPDLLSFLGEMTQENASARDQRIGSFLLSRIHEKAYSFTLEDYSATTTQSKSGNNDDMRLAVNLGLITRTRSMPVVYTICLHPTLGINSAGLTPQQRENLTLLFGKFGGATFSVGDCVTLFGQTGSTVAYHLMNFEERGLILQIRNPGKASNYTLQVTPQQHPECFNMEKLSELGAVG